MSVNNIKKVDPVGMIPIQRMFLSAFKKRISILKKQIKIKIVDENYLQYWNVFPVVFEKKDKKEYIGNQEKIELLIAWLLLTTKQTLLQDPLYLKWYLPYIRSTYKKGIKDALKRIAKKKKLSKDSLPLFERSLYLKFSEQLTFLELKTSLAVDSIVSGIVDSITKSMVDSVSKGLSPNKVVSEINASIDKIVKNRIIPLVTYEIARSYNRATLDTYSEFGISEVGAVVEFRTMQDAAVCHKCASLEGNIYAIEDAYDIIPVHPNCRCFWLPRL